MKERKKSIHKNQPTSTKTQNILLFNLIIFYIFRGTKVVRLGKCKTFCNCVSTTYAPVCGEDGRTYSSWCSAQCE